MQADQMTSAAAYVTEGAYDEAFDRDGRPREHYVDVLRELGDTDLTAAADAVTGYLDRNGVMFGLDAPFQVDPVPRILTAHEWAQLSTGLEQRVRALDAFTNDVYGERRVVAEGIVPRRVVEEAAYYEDDLRGCRPAAGGRISLTGLDVIRDSDGRFRVLEDNVRTPSGLAFAMAAVEAVADAVPALAIAHRPEDVGAAVRRVLEASAPDIDGELVLLTDGESNTAFYEHARLAAIAGLQLTTPDELRRRGTRVELRDGRRVRAVYRRTAEDRIRERSGALTTEAELLLEPVREGGVGLVNWFGNGVADDKDVYAYVDDLIRFFLGQEPEVPSVPTYELVDRERREAVLDRLEELVVKPRDGQGGDGVVVGRTATSQELDRARAAIRENPHGWIAQDTILLSTHPTAVDGALAPRHIDLRPFVFFDGESVVVPRGGLTRYARGEGSMIVNSSKDGGAKPTWVLP